VKMF